MFSFATVMIAAALAMIHSRKDIVADQETPAFPVVKIVITGAIVGLESGFVGAGGGFQVVPALALMARLPIKLTTASLLFVTMLSTAWLAGYVLSTPVGWTLALSIAGAVVLGSDLGFLLNGRIPDCRLCKVFSVPLLITAVVVVEESIQMPG